MYLSSTNDFLIPNYLRVSPTSKFTSSNEIQNKEKFKQKIKKYYFVLQKNKKEDRVNTIKN